MQSNIRDITHSVIAPILQVHDHIDSIFYEITPHDNISKENKEKMENFGMELLYGSLKNGLGHTMLAHYQQYVSKKIRETQIAFFLDKQDAANKAKQIQNNFEEIENFYRNNPEKQEFIYSAHSNPDSLEKALDITYDSLNKFYPYNKERFSESFMHEIADLIQNCSDSNIYLFYNNLLSSFDLSIK